MAITIALSPASTRSMTTIANSTEKNSGGKSSNFQFLANFGYSGRRNAAMRSASGGWVMDRRLMPRP